MFNDNADVLSGQNDPFREDFYVSPYTEELEERARASRQDNEDAIRLFVECLAWEAMDSPELRRIVISLLWHWSDIEPSWIAEALFLDLRQVCEIAEAQPLKYFNCLDCGSQIEIINRHHLMRLDRSLRAISRGEVQRHLGDLLCIACAEQRVETEEERQQVRDLRHQVYVDELRKMPYAERLVTREWQVIRNRMLRRAGYRCQLCESRDRLNVHHRTYANFGDERLEDLIVLCRSCHMHFHHIVDAS